MAATYETIDGEVLDCIAFRYYGTLSSAQLALVLEANRGIGDLGAELPAGTIVNLPDVPATSTVSEVSLWD